MGDVLAEGRELWAGCLGWEWLGCRGAGWGQECEGRQVGIDTARDTSPASCAGGGSSELLPSALQARVFV